MYSKVEARFWDDEKVLSLSSDGRYLMLYLLTTKHRNVIGCYRMPRSYAREDMGLTEKRFCTAWNELLKSEMVEYDEETKTVFLKNYLRHNPIDGPKQAAGAVTKLETMPDNPLLGHVLIRIEAEAAAGKSYLKPLADALSRRLNEAAHPHQSGGPKTGEGFPGDTPREPFGASAEEDDENGKYSGKPGYRKQAAVKETVCSTVCGTVSDTVEDTVCGTGPIAGNRKQEKENREQVVVVETCYGQPQPRRGETDQTMLSQIQAVFRENHGDAYCTPAAVKRMAEWVNRMGTVMVETAILHCAELGKKPWGYIEKCLAAWEQQGIKTPGEVKNHEENREKARKGTGGSKQDGNPQRRFMRHGYDIEKLERFFDLPEEIAEKE